MSDKELQAIVDTLQEQRNAALNAIAKVQGEKAALQEQLDRLQKQLDAIPKTEELPEAVVA